MTHIVKHFKLEVSSINGSLNALEEVLFLKNLLDSEKLPLNFRISSGSYPVGSSDVTIITVSVEEGIETTVSQVQKVWLNFLPWLGLSETLRPGPQSLKPTKSAKIVLLNREAPTIAHIWSSGKEFGSIVTHYKSN